MIILNFFLDHLGVILILAGLLLVAYVLWVFWDDEKRYDKPPVCKSKHVPSVPRYPSSYHDKPYQTPFEAHTQAEIKATTKPHPKPKRH
jgi:hypothetical protein